METKQSEKLYAKQRKGYKSQLKEKLKIVAARNGQLLKQMEGMSSPDQVKGLINLFVQASEDVFGEGASKKIFDRVTEITTNQMAEAAKKSAPEAGISIPEPNQG